MGTVVCTSFHICLIQQLLNNHPCLISVSSQICPTLTYIQRYHIVNINHITNTKTTYINKQMDWIHKSGLKKLQQLSDNIWAWNIMGQSLLPEIQLVVLMNQKYRQTVFALIEDFGAVNIPLHNSMNLTKSQIQNKNQQMVCRQQSLQQQQTDIKNRQLYQLYRMVDKIKGSIHLIRGLTDGRIRDSQFRKRQKLIDTFNRSRNGIFIVFGHEQYQGLMRSHQCLSQFGLIKNGNKIIYYSEESSKIQLHYLILLKYEELFKFQLVRNYRIMKETRKTLEKELGRYLQWQKLLNNQIDPISYSLLMFKKYTETMKCSFSGTYSSDSHYENIGFDKSIHWKISEILNAFWQIEGDMLFKTVDSMSLAYIQEQYKMNDYYSIGGFLPDTCFRQIFSPPLSNLQSSLMHTLQTILTHISSHIQSALSHTFHNTSILPTYLENQLAQLLPLIKQFQNHFNSSIQSQIQYIYAPPQQFWNYRQLNSSLYTVQQQILIQIKYIGKTYVRRVYEKIKESVLRMIGQNLLKNIVKYMSVDAFAVFTKTCQEVKFQIQIQPAEREQYRLKNRRLKDVNRCIGYFGLKVSSPIFIKNFHGKRKKDWDRMFGIEDKVLIKSSKALIQRDMQNKGGFINWMKNAFATKKIEKKADKRSHSIQKNRQQKDIKPSLNLSQRKILNQKQWLLIINTGKQVEHQKINQSAIEGFPSRMRNSIWVYMASKSQTYKQHIKLTKVLEKGKVEQDNRKQILKDVYRTPPTNMFKYSLRESLIRVLQGYSIYDPQLGYTQGMNFMTAVFLLSFSNYQQKQSHLTEGMINYQEIEEKSFLLLKYLMRESGVRKIMSINAQLISEISIRLQNRIKQLSPVLIQKIEQTPFSCQMIFSSPLLSCLTGIQMDFKLQKRIMDVLLTQGCFITYRIIARFIVAAQSQILKLNDDNIFNYMRASIFQDVYDTVGNQGLTFMFQNL